MYLVWSTMGFQICMYFAYHSCLLPATAGTHAVRGRRRLPAALRMARNQASSSRVRMVALPTLHLPVVPLLTTPVRHRRTGSRLCGHPALPSPPAPSQLPPRPSSGRPRPHCRDS
eukprot:SAG31_NODE_3053_length_4739_cov_24.623060_7_plen_115_part_00